MLQKRYKNATKMLQWRSNSVNKKWVKTDAKTVDSVAMKDRTGCGSAAQIRSKAAFCYRFCCPV